MSIVLATESAFGYRCPMMTNTNKEPNMNATISTHLRDNNGRLAPWARLAFCPAAARPAVKAAGARFVGDGWIFPVDSLAAVVAGLAAAGVTVADPRRDTADWEAFARANALVLGGTVNATGVESHKAAVARLMASAR